MTRSTFLPFGLILLVLSLLLTLMVPATFSGEDLGIRFALWLQEAAFWLGMFFIAAHLLRLALSSSLSETDRA